LKINDCITTGHSLGIQKKDIQEFKNMVFEWVYLKISKIRTGINLLLNRKNKDELDC